MQQQASNYTIKQFVLWWVVALIIVILGMIFGLSRLAHAAPKTITIEGCTVVSTQISSRGMTVFCTGDTDGPKAMGTFEGSVGISKGFYIPGSTGSNNEITTDKK